MSLQRRTALVLTTVAATVGPATPAMAMPARDVPGPADAASVLVPSAAAVPAHGDGAGTLTVVLLSAGALVAGGALGFGGARLRHGDTTLRSH